MQMLGNAFPLPLRLKKVTYKTGYLGGGGVTAYMSCKQEGGEAFGISYAAETRPIAKYIVLIKGTIKNLRVACGAAPGAGDTYTFTVRVNGAATTLTATISGAELSASDLVNEIDVAVGDLVTIQVITSATATNTQVAASFCHIYYSLNHKEYANFNDNNSNIPAGTTCYLTSEHLSMDTNSSYVGASTWPTTQYLCIRKGTFRLLNVIAEAAPGAGETFEYTLCVNGVATALTVTLSGAAEVNGMDTTNVIQVDVGDRVNLKVVTSGAATACMHMACLLFEEGDYRA